MHNEIDPLFWPPSMMDWANESRCCHDGGEDEINHAARAAGLRCTCVTTVAPWFKRYIEPKKETL